MAAPSASSIILPLDTGNTGKQVRTQTRTVGGSTVHEHFFVQVDPRDVLGIYWVGTGLITPPSSADNGTTTGQVWLVNPAGSAVKVAVRAIQVKWMLAGIGTADVSAQRLAFDLFTETGAPSGATLAYAKRDSQDAAPISSARTASTGMTVTLGSLLRTDLPPSVTGTTGVGAADSIMSYDRAVPYEEHTILRAGEGIVGFFADAGTASTTRRCQITFLLEEFS